MSEKEGTFLHSYLQLNKGTEIPDIFALWCGLSTLSATLGRNVYVDMGVYKVFPNLYTVLVAGSGRCRKSTSISVAEDLLYKLEKKPRLISQKITPEALIEAMKTPLEYDLLGSRAIGFVVADELATFLNKKTYEAGLPPLLISFFDCKPFFEYHTKLRGVEKLEDTCLGLLAGSTPDWIKAAIPEEAIGSGLTSRIIFVYVEKPQDPVAITRYEPHKEVLKTQLVAYLDKLRNLEGEFKLTPDAFREFQTIYDEFYKSSSFYDSATLSGYASRRHVHLLKLAMMLAVSEAPRLVIEPRHLLAAQDLLVECEVYMPKIMSILTENETGTEIALVLKIIRGRKQISAGDLLKAVSHKMNKQALQQVVDTLIEQGSIDIVSDGVSKSYLRYKSGS